MSSEINIVAILTPKPGRLARLKELLDAMCANVHEFEDRTNRYITLEQIGADGTPKIIVFETYADKAALGHHNNTPYFKQFFKTVTGEDVLAEDAFLAQTVSVAGFDRDRVLM